MPDAITMRDPFGKASPSREVVRIIAQQQSMRLSLPDMKDQFSIRQVNEGGSADPASLKDGSFYIKPGVYLITRNGKAFKASVSNEFAAPQMKNEEPLMVYNPLSVVTEGQPFAIQVKFADADTSAKLSIELRNSSNKWKAISMQRVNTFEYVAQVPADMATPGLINYRIIAHAHNSMYTFPGGYKGDPYAWDNVHNDSWQTFVAAMKTPVTLFDPSEDRETVTLYNPDWRNNRMEYITGEDPERLVLKLTMKKSAGSQLMGFQTFLAEKIKGRKGELSNIRKIVIRARTDQQTPLSVRLGLISTDAQAFVANAIVSNVWKDIEIPVASLKKDSSLLLPRPFPGFLPLWFSSNSSKEFVLQDIEKLELSFGQDLSSNATGSIEIASVKLVSSEFSLSR
jgi:hypothetical protein